MPADLPPADPPHSEGICSRLWIANRGDAASGGERAEGDGDFEIANGDASTSACSAHDCLRHPFVRALADGSLPVDSFRFYVAQGEIIFVCGFFVSAFLRNLPFTAPSLSSAL